MRFQATLYEAGVNGERLAWSDTGLEQCDQRRIDRICHWQLVTMDPADVERCSVVTEVREARAFKRDVLFPPGC